MPSENTPLLGAAQSVQVVTVKPLAQRSHKFWAVLPSYQKTVYPAIALLNCSPVIESFNDGMALHFTAQQISTLYPGTQPGPYFSIGDLVGGVVGFYLGRKLILFPARSPDTGTRIIRAATDGLTIYLFAMNDVIKSFLDLHPETKDISNAKFWGQLAVFPAALLLFYTGWFSISPSTKERWFPPHTRRATFKKVSDWVLTFIYSSRVWQSTFVRFFHLPQHMIYQSVSVLPAMAVASLQVCSPHKQMMMGLTNLLTVANYVGMFHDSLSSEVENRFGEPESLGYVRIVWWLLLAILGTLYTVSHGKSFLRNYSEVIEATDEVSDDHPPSDSHCLTWCYGRKKQGSLKKEKATVEASTPDQSSVRSKIKPQGSLLV